MRPIFCFVFISAFIMMSYTAVAQQKDKAENLYQEGLVQMEGRGNYKKALEIFGQIMKDFARDRRVAAKAQFQTGVCYEKLGRSEAQRAYEQTIAKYPDQADLVAQARARLSALSSAEGTGRGPLARRLLSKEDIDIENLVLMKPSPDGKCVAFMDEYGGIFMRELASGKTEKLADGLPKAYNLSPLWSPDGNRIAYFSAFDNLLSKVSVKILDRATREDVIVPGTETTFRAGKSLAINPVDWSRDGRFLLLGPATLGGDARGPLGIMPTIGGAITILADSAAGSATFSPDGRYVTFASGNKGSEQVFIQSVSGGVRSQLTEAQGGNNNPFWAPDGDAIAYQRPEGIWLVPVAEGKASGTSRLIYTTTVTLYLQAWTEAGGLHFTLYNDQKNAYQQPVDPETGTPTSPLQRLPHHPTADPDHKWKPSYFAWSPDNQRIAFAGWSRHIAIYAADGSNVLAHQVLEPGEAVQSLWWSKDGGEIAYLSYLSRNGGVQAINPATGKIREVSPRTFSPVMISQSNDGRRKLFRYSTGESGKMQGLVLKEDGLDAARMVAPQTDSLEGPLSYAVFSRLSPRGDYVLFGRQFLKPGENMGSLWIVGSDGTGLRKLGSGDFLSSAVWHPSGRFIAYTATMGKKREVFRVVEFSSGASRDVPLPAGIRNVKVTDWSRDGSLIGIVANQSLWEYWALQGLQETR